MLDYLIVVNRTDPERARHLVSFVDPSIYEQRFDVGSGCHLMLAGPKSATIQSASNSIILGAVHPREDPLPDLGAVFACEKVAKRLIETVWGDYLAVWLDRRSDRVHILRAPFGRLPCYRRTIDSSLVLVSRCHRLTMLGHSPVVSAEAVAAHLAGHGAKSETTSLDQIGELLGGQQIVIGTRETKIETVWNPWSFTTRNLARADAQSQALAVRTAILKSTRQLVGERSKVMLGLSGGLDSSIVAVALAQAGTAVEHLSLTTGDPSGDEARYAKAVTDAVGANLLMVRQSPEHVDLSISAAAGLPRPSARSFSQSGDREIIRLICETGSQAYFNGGGGDSVFCHMHSVAPLLDRFSAEGFSRRLWDTAMDIDAITGCGAFFALRRAAGRALGRRKPYTPPVTGRFLTAQTLEAVPAWDHPWFEEKPYPLPGKQMHAYWIVSIENSLEGYIRDRAVQSFYPLMTQPVIEACLAVPTWQWVSGGINRSIARQAFAAELPPPIRERKTKGAMDGLVVQIYERNRTTIRERLLEGRLSAAGIIDRNTLADAIDRRGPVVGNDYGRIMALLDVEAWWESWG